MFHQLPTEILWIVVDFCNPNTLEEWMALALSCRDLWWALWLNAKYRRLVRAALNRSGHSLPLNDQRVFRMMRNSAAVATWWESFRPQLCGIGFSWKNTSLLPIWHGGHRVSYSQHFSPGQYPANSPLIPSPTRVYFWSVDESWTWMRKLNDPFVTTFEKTRTHPREQRFVQVHTDMILSSNFSLFLYILLCDETFLYPFQRERPADTLFLSNIPRDHFKDAIEVRLCILRLQPSVIAPELFHTCLVPHEVVFWSDPKSLMYSSSSNQINQ